MHITEPCTPRRPRDSDLGAPREVRSIDGSKPHRAHRSAVLVIGLLLWTGPLPALDPGKAIHQYQLDAWGSDEGLPHSSAWAILQTADGYLWLATYAGLLRFDGVRFTAFNATNTPAMTYDTVYTLAEGPDRSLWAGTYGGGLIRLRDGEWTRYTTREGLLDDRVWTLAQSRDGGLWIGTESGLARFQDGRWTSYTPREGLAAERVWALHEDRAGALWIGTAGGLKRLQDGTIRTYTTSDGLGDDQIVALGEDLEGTLWVGTGGGGLSRLDGGSFVSYTTEHGLPGADLETIQADRDGNLWLATAGDGLVRLSLRSGTLAFEQRAGLSTGTMEGILEDRLGNLWICSEERGLIRLRDTPITTYTTREGLPHDRVATVYGDRQGDLWIGTQGGGLARRESGGFVTYTTGDGLASDVVSSIHQRRDGSLVVGTDAGWSWWVPPEGDKWEQGGRFTTADVREIGLPRLPAVYVIEEDWRGRLWLGTESAGLLALDGDRIITFSTSHGLPHNTVWALLEDRRHILWIGTDGGLARLSLRPGAAAPQDREIASGQLPNVRAATFYEDGDGTLWIGTWANGLLRYRDGEFVTYSSEDGLPSPTIYQIVEDDQSHLWISLDLGIARLAKEELDDYARGAVPRLHARLYDRSDGMKSYAGPGGAQPAGWKSRAGKLWFSSTRGLVSIEPSLIRSNQVPPQVIIERVVVDGDPVSSEPATRPLRLDLPPGRGELELHYTGLSFRQPERIHFKYRLDGYDEQWTDARTRRVAYYTNLAPGQYRFRVTAANEDGVWNETGAELAFYLEPRFYQTRIFYAASFFGLILLGWGFSRWRHRRILWRNRVLEKVDRQRRRFVAVLEAKNAEIEAKNEELERFTYTVSHDLKSPLVTIRGFAGLLRADAAAGKIGTVVRDLEQIDDAAVKMAELLDDLLRLSRIGRAIDLPQEIPLAEVARQAVARVAGRIAERGAEVEISPDLPVVSGDPSRLVEVLQNLVENAVKYMGAQPRPRVEIGVRKEPGGAVVYVRDNGTGIAPDDQAKVFGLFARLDEQSEGTGIGLSLVKRIIGAHGGDIWVESEGRGRGSTFCFTLPEAPH